MSLTNASRPCQELQRLRQGLHHVFQSASAVSPEAFHFSLTHQFLPRLCYGQPLTMSLINALTAPEVASLKPTIREVLPLYPLREASQYEGKVARTCSRKPPPQKQKNFPPPNRYSWTHPALPRRCLRSPPLLIRLPLYSSFKIQLL